MTITLSPPRRRLSKAFEPDAPLESEFYADVRNAAIDLLGAASADPPRGVSMAERLGITQHHFYEEDLRLIWLSLDCGRDDGRDAILALAEQALMGAGVWDSTQIPGNLGSMVWSRESLRTAFGLYPRGTVGVPAAARRLIELEALLHDLEAKAQQYELARRRYDDVRTGQTVSSFTSSPITTAPRPRRPPSSPRGTSMGRAAKRMTYRPGAPSGERNRTLLSLRYEMAVARAG